MKILNLIFIILFVICAGLQYNDDDPHIWMPIYLYGAFLCFLAFRGKYNGKLYAIGLLIYFGYAIYLFSSEKGVLVWIREHQAENIIQSMNAKEPWIEKTREFFGLILLIFVLILNSFWLNKTGIGKLNIKENKKLFQ